MALDSFRITRDAWRALSRSPGLIAAAVVSLGIGIGANLTTFGVLRAIEPARISVKRVSGGPFATLGTGASVGRGFTDADVNVTHVVLSHRLWRDRLNW